MSRLQDLRKKAGLTQYELADKAGISKRAVEDMEADNRMHLYTAKGETLFNLARVLGCTVDDLLKDLADVRFRIYKQKIVNKGLGWEGEAEADIIYEAFDIDKAKKYWGDYVDLYYEGVGCELTDDYKHGIEVGITEDTYEDGDLVDSQIVWSNRYHE